MIRFVLNPKSGVATFVQLQQQVKQAIRMGALAPGDQLPTAREVVECLAINPNTVLKAYRELERDGLVEPRPGTGTFVTGTLGGADPVAVGRSRRQLAGWIRAARQAGLDSDDIVALFQDEMALAEQERTA